MLVTVTDFSRERNLDRDTVNAYIRRHPEIKEHISRVGKNAVIDTESNGYALLDEKYPFPQIVQVIEDTESRKQLIEAQKLIIQLQEKLHAQTGSIAKAEAVQLLLEEKEKRLEEAAAALDEAKDNLKHLNCELNQYQKTIFGLYKKVKK